MPELRGAAPRSAGHSGPGRAERAQTVRALREAGLRPAPPDTQDQGGRSAHKQSGRFAKRGVCPSCAGLCPAPPDIQDQGGQIARKQSGRFAKREGEGSYLGAGS